MALKTQPKKFPVRLRYTYNCLLGEIEWLNRSVRMVHDLYVGDETKIKWQRDIAPDFFGFLQHVLYDSMVISLCRMTDGKGNSSQKNITFSRLVSLINQKHLPTLHAQTFAQLSKINKISKPIRKHRNKRVAHSDLTYSKRKLPNFRLTHFNKALDEATVMLNLVSAHYGNFSVSKKVCPAPGGTADLLHALKRAYEMKAENNFKYVMDFNNNETSPQQTFTRIT